MHFAFAPVRLFVARVNEHCFRDPSIPLVLADTHLVFFCGLSETNAIQRLDLFFVRGLVKFLRALA